ncbi:histone-like nucleoid-structuring protein Lsr2 [Streptomyces sp. NPDC001930]|uniref:Lsr2 family DNA-binding protein n=1 Tax=Streptomyces sp. NPDC001930 TaxID=3364625 RepID=UPI00367B4FFE
MMIRTHPPFHPARSVRDQEGPRRQASVRCGDHPRQSCSRRAPPTTPSLTPKDPMTALTALTTLCPPPPAAPPAPDWSRIEDELGMNLPQDYKQLVATYGPGQFCGFITLYQPHAPSEWADLTGPMPVRLRSQIEEVRQAARHPWALPHSLENLFAMGVTGNGDYLFWVTQPAGTPEEWNVAVNEALRAPWFTYIGSLTEFLVTALSGTTRIPMFPKDLLDNGATFTPATLRSTAPAEAAWTSVSTRTIRDWANANGYDLPERGRIPSEVMQAWEQENSSSG